MLRSQLQRLPLMKGQRGVGLIEVLIATLVLSIGVLGYAGLQLRALNSTEESYNRTQATAIARDVAERMAANATIDSVQIYTQAGSWAGADNFTRDMPGNWNQCLNTTACSNNDVARNDILQARWQAWNLLPSGRVQAADCAGSGLSPATVCVVVSWGESDPGTCNQQSGPECVVLEMYLERIEPRT